MTIVYLSTEANDSDEKMNENGLPISWEFAKDVSREIMDYLKFADLKRRYGRQYIPMDLVQGYVDGLLQSRRPFEIRMMKCAWRKSEGIELRFTVLNPGESIRRVYTARWALDLTLESEKSNMQDEVLS